MSLITRGFGDKQSIIIRGFNLPLEIHITPTPTGIGIQVELPRLEKTLIDVVVKIPLRGTALQRLVHAVSLVGYVLLPVDYGVLLAASALRRVQAVASWTGESFDKLEAKINLRGAMKKTTEYFLEYQGKKRKKKS